MINHYLARPYAYSLIFSLLVLFSTIIPIGFARYGRRFEYSFLKTPRMLFPKYSDWGKRAKWAHQNSFESFILYSPSILLAIFISLQDISLPLITKDSALLYPIFRLIYVAMYIINKPILRSFFWGGSIGCIFLMYYFCFITVFI